MSEEEVTARRISRRALLTLATCLGAMTCLGSMPCLAASTPATAAAPTRVGVQPSLQPYRLGARARATVALPFYGGVDHVPAPLSSAVLRFPAGLLIDLSRLGSCSSGRLRSRGAAGCPASSLLGRGSATLEVHAGSQTVPENAAVSVFRGPDRGGHPTFEILGHGSTPLDETTISSAVLLADAPPYGSKLVITVPPIPTLRFEPNASFSALSLTIGGTPHARNPIVIPRRCPSGGFAFAASFSFADRTTAEQGGRLPCP